MLAGAIGWLKALTIGKKIGLGVATLLTATAAAAPITTPPDTSQDSQQSQVQGTEIEKPQTETKTITETEVIQFSSSQQDDATINSGETTIAVVGVNGEKTKTYEITLVDGKETSRKLVSEKITKEPVNEIKKVGTKIEVIREAPSSTTTSCSGGYINVDGNCVQSPGSNPAGASAKCRDGTYSYSQNRRGTCSGHGGVAEWY